MEQNQILEILSNNTSLRPEDIKLTDTLEDDLQLDSLDMTSIQMDLESQGVRLTDEELQSLTDVQSLINLIDSKN